MVYDVEMIENICMRVSCGEYLSAICAEPGMLPRQEFYRLMVKCPEVREQYELARLNRIETKEEELHDMLQKAPEKRDALKKLELAIKLETWVMAKLNPLKYGEKTTIQGDKNNPIEVRLSNSLDERIAAREARKTIEHVPKRESPMHVIDVIESSDLD